MKTDLLVKHGAEYFKVAADSRYLPSSSVAQKLFESEFSKSYGSFSGSETFSMLEDQIEQYNKENSDSGGKVKFGRVGNSQYLRISLTDTPCYVSLFTELGNPLMHKSVNHDFCAQCCNSCKIRRCCSVKNETFITSSTITFNVATQYICRGSTLLFMHICKTLVLSNRRC